MVKVRVPLRLTLAGGGTDLPSYYEKHGGLVLATTIDKYINIKVEESDMFEVIIDSGPPYSASKAENIGHSIIRATFECIERLSGKPLPNLRIEITNDLSGNSGLGSSGALTVGLLLAYSILFNLDLTLRELAETAFSVERYMLNQPVGKQDQYIAAIGGARALLISRTGQVWVHPIKADLSLLETHLMLFDTRIRRGAADILKHQDTPTVQVTDSVSKIHEMAPKIHDFLLKYRFEDFGRSMDEHWHTKKKISPNMTTPFIENAYGLAKNAGAYGGKIVGAGGGGFLLLYVSPVDRATVKRLLTAKGLQLVDFKFTDAGAQEVANDW